MGLFCHFEGGERSDAGLSGISVVYAVAHLHLVQCFFHRASFYESRHELGLWKVWQEVVRLVESDEVLNLQSPRKLRGEVMMPLRSEWLLPHEQ